MVFDFEWSDLVSWSYAGVNNSLVGNGGRECAEFIPTYQKVAETLIFSLIGIFEVGFAWPRLTLPSKLQCSSVDGNEASRRVLLVIMCVTFGVELGFKLASQQFIWVLNPCHLITIMQIILLLAPPSRAVTALFRIQMHCLNGATIAILFPIVNTRTLPFETQTYFLQHLLLLVVPFYLMRFGGPFITESYGDFSWVFFTLGLLFLYHWIPLQFLAMLSLVNLNNIMCPAVSDPFNSRWYRIGASVHQTALILFHGKLYTFICSPSLPSRRRESDDSSSRASEKSVTGVGNGGVATTLKTSNVVTGCNGYSKAQ